MTSPAVTAPPRRPWRWIVPAVGTAAVLAGGFALASHLIRPDPRKDALALADTAPPGQALPALVAALERHPDDPALLRAVVLTLRRAGKSPEEVEPYTARWCRAAAPDDAAPWRLRMELLQELHRPSADIIECGEHLLALEPGDQQTRLLVAELYHIVGRFDDAIREANRLLADPPLAPAVIRVGIARAELGRGNPAAAAAQLDQVLATTPDDAQALLLRGHIHLQAGEYPQAVAAYRRAKPTDTVGRQTRLNQLGLALTRSGQADEAKRVFGEFARLQRASHLLADANQQQNDRALQLRAAAALLECGEAEDARALVEADLGRLGPTKAGLNLLADSLDRLGHHDRAKAARDEAARHP